MCPRPFFYKLKDQTCRIDLLSCNCCRALHFCPSILENVRDFLVIGLKRRCMNQAGATLSMRPRLKSIKMHFNLTFCLLCNNWGKRKVWKNFDNNTHNIQSKYKISLHKNLFSDFHPLEEFPYRKPQEPNWFLKQPKLYQKHSVDTYIVRTQAGIYRTYK